MKNPIIFIFMILLSLANCNLNQTKNTQSTQVISTISAETCFLCGNGTGKSLYWGQNNIGIISLNNFEVMPIEINHYDDQGELVTENIGHTTIKGFHNQENGFYAHVFENADRGYAECSIIFNKDEILNPQKTSMFLCQNCLDTVLSGIYKHGFGIGIINFSTKEIFVLEESFTGFGLGDYYIDCDWKEPENIKDLHEVDILVLYCPLRYMEKEQK